MPSKKSRKNSRPGTYSRSSTQRPLYGPPPLVSLRWLLGAAVAAVGLGALGAYLVLCVIFYQNQAMLIFKPSHKITATPASAGMQYQEVSFDRAADGQPRLTGWWIPAKKNAAHGGGTILYLHAAKGSLSDTVGQLAALHKLGVNVFAFDYQGFGKSAGPRPTEKLADRDTLAAWSYLTTVRKLPADSLVIYGEGAGATFATHLAARRRAAGLVLVEISPTAHAIFEQDARARLLPLFLLAKEHLNPAPELKRLQTPKLFVSWPVKSGNGSRKTRHDYRLAASPKQYAAVSGPVPEDIAGAVQPFLAQVLKPRR